ncbi:hypothetical protein L083_2093 [Actinoplanes sp. N902-109]|nr:hypothetical protein L083_2093 [Actinoplanes sp. N902-109]
MGLRKSHRASDRHSCFRFRSGRRRPCKVSRYYVSLRRSPPGADRSHCGDPGSVVSRGGARGYRHLPPAGAFLRRRSP